MGVDNSECPIKIINTTAKCSYVEDNSDSCVGGGYIPWSFAYYCAENDFLIFLIIIAALIFFVYLFILLTSTADDFFSTNIAVIIDQHKISQNIAGITFMAFGNGAPDIFSSIASVISVEKPKADLAIGELLGGGIFVTTIVVAAIIFTQPFNVMRRPVLRDILFYLFALGLLICIVNTNNEIHLWMPISFLVIYLLYASTVVSGNVVYRRIQKQKREKCLYNNAETILNSGSIIPSKISKMRKVAPISLPLNENGKKADLETSFGEISIIKVPQYLKRNYSGHYKSSTTFPTKLIIPIDKPIDSIFKLHSKNSQNHHLHDNQHRQHHKIINSIEDVKEGTEIAAEECLECGKFFAKEILDYAENYDTTSTTISPIEKDKNINSNNKMTISATEIGATLPSISHSPTSSTSSTNSLISSTTSNLVKVKCIKKLTKKEFYKKQLKRFAKNLNPLHIKEFNKAKWYLKIYHVMKIPSLLILNLSVPLANAKWNKFSVMLQAFLAPILFCFAFQKAKTRIISILPETWILGLIVSLIFNFFILLFTKFDKTPKFYKPISAYFGFILSIAWIYMTASEVVNVVLMFGNIFGIPYQLLGLTAVAWSNSIGDLIADFSVARQGFPRMAFSAAIGGPLFNLLVGFGGTFLIAKIRKKTVTIAKNDIQITMFVGLGVSLVGTLCLLIFQRFRARTIHGVCLITIYIAFIVSVMIIFLNKS